MNYTDMSTKERDRLVHKLVMELPLETPCSNPNAELNIYADYYWQCTCGWSGPIGGPTEHCIPIPRYHEELHAAWAIIHHIADLPDTSFTEVQKKRRFMRMLGMQPCNDLTFGALTLKQLSALTPETICTAALYVFGRGKE